MDHNVGDIVWFYCTPEHLGISVAKLLSRHDEEHWDIERNPGGYTPDLAVIHETEIVPSPL